MPAFVQLKLLISQKAAAIGCFSLSKAETMAEQHQ